MTSARVAVTYATVYEGPAIERNGEDGPEAIILQCVAAKARDGIEYVYGDAFERRASAERLARRVNAMGSIDPALWVVPEPRPSLEELWAIEAEAEREDRAHYGRG